MARLRDSRGERGQCVETYRLTTDGAPSASSTRPRRGLRPFSSADRCHLMPGDTRHLPANSTFFEMVRARFTTDALRSWNKDSVSTRARIMIRSILVAGVIVCFAALAGVARAGLTDSTGLQPVTAATQPTAATTPSAPAPVQSAAAPLQQAVTTTATSTPKTTSAPTPVPSAPT